MLFGLDVFEEPDWAAEKTGAIIVDGAAAEVELVISTLSKQVASGNILWVPQSWSQVRE